MLAQQVFAPILKQYGIFHTTSAFIKYTYLAYSHGSKNRWNFTDITSDPVRVMSIRDLIDSYQLQPVEKMFSLYLSIFGYGTLDQLPAGLAFDYCSPTVFNTVLHSIPVLNRFSRPTLASIQEGFQGLFECIQGRLAEGTQGKSKVDFIFNTPIDQVAPEAGNVRVNAKDGTWLARRVIVSCPPDLLKLPHLTELERSLLGSLQPQFYGTTVFRTKRPIPCEFYPIWNFKGHESSGIFQKFPDQPIYTSYAYGKPEESADIVECLRGCVRKNFGEEIEILAQRQVRYYPRLSLEEMRRDGFRKLDQMQRDGIYMAGSVTSFELVEAVLQSSNYLIMKHFSPSVR